MTTRVSLDHEDRRRLSELTRETGKSGSEVMKEALRLYQEHLHQQHLYQEQAQAAGLSLAERRATADFVGSGDGHPDLAPGYEGRIASILRGEADDDPEED